MLSVDSTQAAIQELYFNKIIVGTDPIQYQYQLPAGLGQITSVFGQEDCLWAHVHIEF